MKPNASGLVLAADERYFPFACIVARQAIARARKPLPATIIFDGVSRKNLDLAKEYCPQLRFADAGSLLDGKHLETGKWLSRAAYLRLFMDEIEELDGLDRVLYVDCDVSFLADPWDLLNTELDGAPVAAAYDLRSLVDTSFRNRLQLFDGAPYFNSGVMLFDLAATRAQGDFEKARTFALEHPDLCEAHDQDALNVAFQGRWQVLDWRWNAVSLNAELMNKAPFIRHFTGKKPWAADKRGVERHYIGLWEEAVSNSPWPDRFTPIQPFANRLKYSLFPLVQKLEKGFKSRLFANADTARGNRSRLLRQFPSVLKQIEKAAAEHRLATPFPERVLLNHDRS